MSNAVRHYIRKRALRFGSFIIYQENGKIIKEDPRTGLKTVLTSTKNK